MFSLIPWRKNEGTGSTALARAEEHPLRRMRGEFDALFDRFFAGWPTPFGTDWDWQRGWGLDVDDTGNEVVVRADAPGFEVEDFDVSVSGNVLTVRAERKQEAGERQGDSYQFSERRLHRTVTLPAGTDPDRVEARYRNGVLEVRLPKTAEAQGRRITVQS